jgi:hypothetical protein
MVSLIFPTTADRFLTTSSFRPHPSSPKSDKFIFSDSGSVSMSDLGEVPKAEGVTIKVNNESLYNLLPPKMDSQFIRPQFLPQDYLGGSHFAAKFFRALKFLFGDFLICDDVFDRHGGIVR